jgi:hypothetical protein
MSKGYQTSEFWLSLFAMLIGAVMASGLLALPGTPAWTVQIVGIIASILGGLGYTVPRAMLKSADVKAGALVAAAAGSAAPVNPPQP